MSKVNMSATEVLANLPEEMRALLSDEKLSEMKKAAAEIDRERFVSDALVILIGDEKHTGKMIEVDGEKPAATKKRASALADSVFALAAEISENVVSEEKSVQGGGKREKAYFTLVTPSGTLKVELTK